MSGSSDPRDHPHRLDRTNADVLTRPSRAKSRVLPRARVCCGGDPTAAGKPHLLISGVLGFLPGNHGRRHLEFACRLARQQVERGRRVLFEPLWAATSWNEPCLKELSTMDGMRRLRCDRCQFGPTSVDDARERPTWALPCDETMDEINVLFHAALMALKSNKALDSFIGTGNGDGMEATSSRRYDPGTAGRSRGLLRESLSPGKGTVENLRCNVESSRSWSANAVTDATTLETN